jgi:hypothetical protein
MRTNNIATIQIGDLIETAFNWAARYSTDGAEVSRLATAAVLRTLRSAPGPLVPPRPTDDRTAWRKWKGA